MSRQPKARSTKAAARVNAFYDLEARTKDVPAADLRADFGGMEMVRQGKEPLWCRSSDLYWGVLVVEGVESLQQSMTD